MAEQRKHLATVGPDADDADLDALANELYDRLVTDRDEFRRRRAELRNDARRSDTGADDD